jgi:large subunit ribosomal protein L24e
MKRNPRKLAWTKSFRRAHGKEMTVDSTLAFAQRRNIPVRYNRDLVATTLQAMQRVSEIRSKRERQFYKNRMKGNKAKQMEADRKLVAENQHLLPPQYRDQVQEVLDEDTMVEDLEEQTEELDPMEEEEELDLEVQEKVKAPKAKGKNTKQKQRLVRGKGIEAMDVDG